MSGTLALMVWVASCGGNDQPTGPSATGSVKVTVTTTGQDLDTGYSASAGGTSQNVTANGSVTFTGVEVGSQTVTLSGVASNCTVTGGASQSVTVSEGQTTTVTFVVVCTAAGNAGSLLDEALDSLEQAMYAALNIDSVADLDNVSFAQTNSLFQQALAASPSNDTAAFGAAVTTIFMLEDDPDIRALANDWEAWLDDGSAAPTLAALVPASALAWNPVSLPLEMSGTDLRQVARTGLAAPGVVGAPAAAPPPSVTDMQAALKDIVSPALQDALTLLEEITNPDFTFTVTPGMQGELPAEADPLDLDYTEVLALQAGVQVAVAGVDVATAYVLEPNPLSAQGFVDAMDPGSTFLTLSSGGAAGLSDALTRLQAAADILLDGLDNLEAESDDQSDDIIKYDPAGAGDGLSPSDITDARNVITDVKNSLTTATTVTVNEGTPDEISFDLDARQFFVNPIADFKDLLPPYEVFTATEEAETVPVLRWTALNVADWTLPDPTLNGILPNSTQQDLIDDFGVDDLFFGSSLVGGGYRLISIDGVDCLNDLSTGGNGCQVGTDYVSDGSMNLDGDNGAPVGWLFINGTSYLSAFGPYSVADDNDGDPTTFAVTLDVTTDATSQPPNTELVLSATITDQPGYTSLDGYGRERGGSQLTFDYQGSTWVFARQP